ncbi:TPA: cell surface protein, partial [Streptococcus equi subsp. zooepidemicus]|nr:cell surface protein [Streptococcus equi subsp. zooepidemicus]
MKRQSNIRRLCHQALAATLITGSLMGTGLLGNKVVYGDVSSDADSIKKVLTSGENLKESLQKVTDPKTLFGLFAILSGDFGLDNESDNLVITTLSDLVSDFSKSGNNSNNRKAVIEEIKRRVLSLESAKKNEQIAKKEAEKNKKDLETEKLQNGILSRDLNASREAHRVLSKLFDDLEEKFAKAKIDKKQAEEQAKKAITAKEKAEKDVKTAQQESEQAKKAADQAETDKKKAQDEAKNAKLDSQRAQEEANKLRGEAEKAKQEAEK